MIDKIRVAVGMSGGVDSSVSAAILKEQGYDVTGVYIEAYNEPGCRTDQDKRDALQAALRIGVPFTTIDVRKEYKEIVVKYFFDEYKAGRTPNPDIVCNAQVKFGIFGEWARQKGFDYVATGHYVRKSANPYIRKSVYPQYILQRPKDAKKDQSYFLWEVEPKILEKVIWPLGEMTKQQVREKAKELGLANADKPDSMGVCMMGELNVAQFLKENLGERKGEVTIKSAPSANKQMINEKDLVVGEHKGLWFYTLGQRVGNSNIELRISEIQKAGYDTTNLPPMYVVGKDKKNNILVIGRREECYKESFGVSGLVYRIPQKQIDDLCSEGKLYVRIRNLGELVGVKAIYNGRVEVVEKIFAPAEGQAAVLYDDKGVVVGGGTIASN